MSGSSVCLCRFSEMSKERGGCGALLSAHLCGSGVHSNLLCLRRALLVRRARLIRVPFQGENPWL